VKHDAKRDRPGGALYRAVLVDAVRAANFAENEPFLVFTRREVLAALRRGHRVLRAEVAVLRKLAEAPRSKLHPLVAGFCRAMRPRRVTEKTDPAEGKAAGRPARAKSNVRRTLRARVRAVNPHRLHWRAQSQCRRDRV